MFGNSTATTPSSGRYAITWYTKSMLVRSASDAAASLRGKSLNDDAVIAAAAEASYTHAKPMDNTDFVLHWRKRVVREFVTYALRELRGEDMRETRRKIGRQDLVQIA